MLIGGAQVHSFEDVPQPVGTIGIKGLKLILQALGYYDLISALHFTASRFSLYANTPGASQLVCSRATISPASHMF